MSITRPGRAKPCGGAASSAFTEGVEFTPEAGRAGGGSAVGARGRLER